VVNPDATTAENDKTPRKVPSGESRASWCEVTFSATDAGFYFCRLVLVFLVRVDVFAASATIRLDGLANVTAASLARFKCKAIRDFFRDA